MATVRWGLTFGAGIAVANLLLQFIVTPFVPWQVVGLLSASAWFAGIVAAGVYAGRAGSIRMAASAAAIAAAVDITRNAAVAIAIGPPTLPSSASQASPTPGLIIAGTIAAFFLLGPLAACIGMVAARVTSRSPARQSVTGD